MAKKYMRKIKAENSSRKILDLEDLEQCTIICFSDPFFKIGIHFKQGQIIFHCSSNASFANLKANSSQGRFAVFLYRNCLEIIQNKKTC